MKHTMKAIVATLLLLTSLTAQGATVTIDDGLTHGSITKAVSGTKVTLTAAPDAGYFLCFDDLSVKAYVDGGNAEGRTREPIPMYTIDVANNGDGTYTFTMPTEGYDVYVTAVFRQAVVTLPVGPYLYNGSAQTPAPTVKIDGTTLVASTDYTVGYMNNVNVGTNTATVTVTGKGKYFGTVAASFSITKKALTITAKDQSVNFGTAITQGTDQVTAEGLVAGHTLTSVTLTQSTTSVTTSGTITPSAATVKIGDTDVTANYDITYKTGKLIINASTAASAVVTANDRTYDGSTQDLVTIGAITNGATGTAADVVFYESATSTTPLTAIPQGTNAGTYEVYYEVTPDGDHTAPARTMITVTISPITAIVTITGHNNTTVYDGTEHSVSGYNVEISTSLYTEADFTFSGTAEAKRTEVGMTTMGLKAEQFTNTNNNFSTVTFNVTDGFQTITPPDAVIVTIIGRSNTTDYDGKEHSVSDYDVKINNPLYTESDFTFSGTAKAARTDAGTTQMGLDESQFTNTNTNFSVTFNVIDGYQTISPIAAAVTITGHNNTTTYDGNEHSVTGYDVTFSNVLYKEGDFTFSGTAEAKRIDEGTTQMGLAKEQFANNSPNFDPVTFTVIDGYQTITAVTDVVVTITGHSNTLDYDGTAHTVSGYDVEISNPLYKVTDFTFSGTAEAARTDAGTTNMGLDAAQFTNTNTDFTTVTFNVTDGYQTINPITATVTIKGHSNIAFYDGTEHSVTGYDVTFSNDLYKQTDFTFSGTASAAQTYKGTTYMGLSEGQFANISANFSKVTFSVTDGYQTIIPAVLTINVNALEKAIGTDDPELTYSVTGLKGTDVLTGSLSRIAGEAVGSYAISQGTLKASDNYTINFTGANLVIYRALDGIFADGNEWATFVAEEDLAIPAGLEAYVVSGVSGTTVNTEVAPFVAKGVGIILKRADKMVNSYRGYAYDGTAAPPTSLLQGSATDATDIQTYKDYVLYNDQFELAGVSSVGKGHAYLPKTVLGNAAGARCLTIIGGDGTGIRTIVFDDVETEENWYDLNGRILNGKPAKKGLYIKDGHKVVIK